MEQRLEPLPAPSYEPRPADEPIVYAAWGQRLGALFLDGLITALLAALAVAVVVGITGGYSAIIEGLESDSEADDDPCLFAYFGWYAAWAVAGGL